MPSYIYPGVYISEIPSGGHPIAGVPTSITAFVGWASRGPTDRATLVTDWSDFEQQFGGLDPRSYLGYAVNQFFENGGEQALIVRLVADGKSGNTAAAPAAVTITGLTFDSSSAPAPSTVAVATGGSGGLVLSANNPGSWGDNYAVQIEPDAVDYTRLSLSVLYIDPATQARSVVESFPNLSLNANDAQSRYAVNIINEQSNFLIAAMKNPVLNVTNVPSVPATPPPPGTATITLSGGNDGTVLNPALVPGPGTFEAGLNASGSATGVHLLDAAPIFNLLVVPGEADPGTIGELQAYCVGRKAFLLVDSELGDNFAKLQSGPNSLMTGVDAINSAFYFPWVNAFDAVQNATRPFPPSGFVAGIYAATDASRGIWKAPAGIDAGLTGQSGLTADLDNGQIGTLNTRAINCIRNFSQYGDVIWGARTLQGDDGAGSEWKYVPVRRLALYLEASLLAGTQWAVFEPNGEQLWAQIRLNVAAFLHALFVQGAFQGSTPAQAYFVKCDAENNPQSSIDTGIVNILVGFAPLYPAEFVSIQIQQMAGELAANGESAGTQFSINTQRLDPYKNFKFRLKLEGNSVAGFSSAGNLKRTTQVVQHREGGDPSTSHDSPGRTKYEAITLARGITHDMAFNDWASDVRSQAAAPPSVDLRKDLVLEIYNETGRLVIAYKIYRCWVSEHEAVPDLDANANAIAIEHIKLENEGWERDPSATESREPALTGGSEMAGKAVAETQSNTMPPSSATAVTSVRLGVEPRSA